MNSNNNELYHIVGIIVNDEDTSKIVQKMSIDQIYETICYLNNKLYYNLVEMIKKIVITFPKHVVLESHIITTKIINYYRICLHKNLDISNILITCKYILMKAGEGNKKPDNKNKNIVMEGITLTLRSILNRKIDVEHIDNNLRQGAIERKAYFAKKYHLKQTKYTNVEPIFDKYTPIGAIKKKYVTSEVSMHPSTRGKHIVHTHTQTKKLSSGTTVKNYKLGVDKIKNLEPNNPLDMPLSQPLDEPPVGKSGATLITSGETISHNKMDDLSTNTNQIITNPIEIEQEKKPSKIELEKKYKSNSVKVVKMPSKMIYNSVPFI